MRKVSLPISILAILTIFTACQSSSKATVDGQFFGNANVKILIEKVTPGTGAQFVDTLTTDSDGAFDFQYIFEDENPVFINIRTADSYTPLLLAPGERVKLSSVGNIYNNYKVSGSEGSENLHKLNMSTIAQVCALDSLITLLNRASDPIVSKELGRQYGQRYVELKRNVIRFVMSNPHSLASIVPLYQPIIGQRYIFDEPTDIVYFRAVADSLAKRYPTSPYVLSLQDDLQHADKSATLDSMLNSGIKAIETSLPPLQLKDAEGELRRLSDLTGKVVMLDFTSLLIPELTVRNRELAEIYDKYKKQGFEIYQISVDENRLAWIRAVVDARLRWISVNDSQGINSPALSAFNVTRLPSNFLIDRQGDIIGRDYTSPTELSKAIEAAL